MKLIDKMQERILFVSYTSDLGGPPISLLKLLKYLVRRHEVAVVAPGNGELFGLLDQIAVPSYRTGPHGLTRRSIPWLCRLIARDKFSVVYGNNFDYGPRNALIAAKLTGRPYVWHIREMLRDRRWRVDFFLRYADVLIAVSKASAQLLQQYVPNKPVHVVYNGIEPEEFELRVREARQHVRRTLNVPSGHLVVANIGVVCTRKGQEYALEIVSQGLRDYPNASIAFLGRRDIEPSYVLRLEEQAVQLKIGHMTRFLGFRHDVPTFLKGSDICLHTPLWDPNPRAILEAMAANLPVVAFDVDGVGEMVVDGQTGFLVPFGDVAAGSAAVRELCNDPSLRARMGEEGRRRARTMFAATSTARQIDNIINRLHTS